MNILVTGATGFIGNRLVEELLKRNYEVIVLSRKPIKTYKVKWAERVTSIQADLTNLTSMVNKVTQGLDIVIHLAAQLGAWKINEKEYYLINVEGTKSLIKQSKETGIKHFIYISTAGVYGTLKQVPVDESHQCNPRYIYEKTKYLAEQYILNEMYYGYPATILRPSHVYGPGDLNTIPLLRLLNKINYFPLIGGGKSFFQPVFIDDLIKGIIQCLENHDIVLGKTYNLAGKDTITFEEYINLISQLLGIKVITLPCSYNIARFFALLNEAFASIVDIKPILTRFRVDFFGGHQYYNIQRAENDFKYHPCIDLKYGMEKTIEWYHINNFI